MTKDELNREWLYYEISSRRNESRIFGNIDQSKFPLPLSVLVGETYKEIILHKIENLFDRDNVFYSKLRK